MSNVATVFYAWQSDLPSKFNRNFIQVALEAAIERINADSNLMYTAKLDHDTKDIPGLCDIPATILDKIETADVFVADLTYIGRSEKSRYCSNPNVLFELGFAFKSIGPERIILVMNEAYGPRAEQIFDLAHRRHPIAYTASETTNMDKQRDNLSRKLEGAIRLTLDHGNSQRQELGKAQFGEQIDAVQAVFQNAIQKESLLQHGYWRFIFHPALFVERWITAQEVEDVIRRRTAGLTFPKIWQSTTGMTWGIYTEHRRVPWALSFNGLFMAYVPYANTSGPFVLRWSNPKENEEIPSGQWIDFIPCLQSFYDFFKFIHQFSSEFSVGEVIHYEVSASSLAGKRMVSTSPAIGRDPTDPAIGDDFVFPGDLSITDLESSWRDECVKVTKRFVDLFPAPPVSEKTILDHFKTFGG